jgi:hypothetical protein
MKDEELKAQIALGLINPAEIRPLLIWGIQDPELLDNLAKIFYGAIEKQFTENGHWPTRDQARVHEEFLNNPNTSTATRIYINNILLMNVKNDTD